MKTLFQSLPRSAGYPLMALSCALAALVALPWALSSAPASAGYLLGASLGVVALMSFLFGRWFDRARFLSVTDPLTGLYNRRYFSERLSAEMSRARRHGSHTCVLCLDVDRLKAINDGFGHKAGDRALVALAQTVTKNLRPTDVFARFGGDEFVVLLPQTGSSEARRLSERLVGAVSRHHEARTEHFEVSIGIAELGPKASSDEVLAAADAALYQAKAAGGGKAVLGDWASQGARASAP